MQRTMTVQGQQGQQGQARQNQINWRQFASLETAQARDEFFEACREHEKHADEAKFDVPVSIPNSRRRCGQTAEKHRPRKVQVQEVPNPNIDDVPHEQVQKAKTRAVRRSNDDDLTLDTPNAETPDMKLPTKRVRRSDYWVQRDDERRSAARTLKAGLQNCQTD